MLPSLPRLHLLTQQMATEHLLWDKQRATNEGTAPKEPSIHVIWAEGSLKVRRDACVAEVEGKGDTGTRKRQRFRQREMEM